MRFTHETLAGDIVVFVALLGMGALALWLLFLPIRVALAGWQWGLGLLRRRKRSKGRYVRVPLAAEVRARVIANAGYRCEECGADTDLTVDHIIARNNGGTNDFDNLRCLCRHCNSVKGTH